MDYADSVHQVLLRKINKAEQDLMRLKLDYCRFIFGLSHRSLVNAKGQVWQVQSVDVASMARDENGGFSRPMVMGIPQGAAAGTEPVSLGTDWMVAADKTSQRVGG